MKPVERWVEVNGKWMHIVFDADRTYVDGVECGYVEHGEKAEKGEGE